MTRLREAPWNQSLADWAAETYGSLTEGPVRLSPRQGLAFAPFEAHRPERFHTRPVVLLVLSRSAAVDSSAFAEAVELVRISTNGFRAAAFTDSYEVSRSIRPEWPVEQTLPEEAWLGRRKDNWLTSAAVHCEWAAEHYGADYVLAPRTIAEAAEAVRVLAHAYNAQPPVLRAALERLEAGQEPQQPAGFRAGWEDLGPGEHTRSFVSADGVRVEAQITVAEGAVGKRAGTLTGAAGTASPGLLAEAHAAGWSSVLLTPHHAGSEHVEAFTAGALRACLDALPARGPVVVFDPAEPWGLKTAERSGTLAQESGGQWRLDLPGVGALRFGEAAAAEVFDAVARITPA